MEPRSLSALEYETMLFTRHLASLPGKARRRSGSLDQSAYVLLSLLDAGGAASIAELAGMTGLDASTLNRQTATLVRKELAHRIPDPEGGAARKFTLSEEGAEALEEERRASRVAIATITAEWEDEERETLVQLLRRFNAGVEQRTQQTVPRP